MTLQEIDCLNTLVFSLILLTFSVCQTLKLVDLFHLDTYMFYRALLYHKRAIGFQQYKMLQHNVAFTLLHVFLASC